MNKNEFQDTVRETDLFKQQEGPVLTQGAVDSLEINRGKEAQRVLTNKAGRSSPRLFEPVHEQHKLGEASQGDREGRLLDAGYLALGDVLDRADYIFCRRPWPSISSRVEP